MACIYSTGYTSTSDCETSFPGVSTTIYFGVRSEVTSILKDPLTGRITGTTGGAQAYAFDINDDSGQLLQNFQPASKAFLHNLNFTLAAPSTEGLQLLNKFAKAKSFALVEQGTKKYFLGEYAGGLKVQVMDNDSGTTIESFQGVTVSLQAKSGILASEITDAAYAALIA